MTRLEVNVSTGSLVSSLQPAPAEGDSYSCQQPVTDRTPAETEHSSSEVVGDSYSCQQPVTDRTPAETEHSSSEVVLHRSLADIVEGLVQQE